MRECGHGEMRKKELRNRRNDITQGWGVLQSLISPSEGNEKKVITTRGIHFWSPIQVQSPQNRAQLWCCPCGIVTLNAIVFDF